MRAAFASMPVIAAPFLMGGGCQRENQIKRTVLQVEASLTKAAECEDGQCDEQWAECMDGGACQSVCRAVALQELGCGGQGNMETCRLRTTKDGVKELHIKVMSACPAGRRPAGLVASSSVTHDGVAGWMAQQAYLEAASVSAFLSLAAELRLRNAPFELIAQAERAARDEIRHAELMKGLAQEWGASVDEPKVKPQAQRSLYAMALENEIEGCVRETVGAALCWRQSLASQVAELRVVMGEIAEDETRHAELAQGISQWVRSQLNADEIHSLDQARANAIDEVLAEMSQQDDDMVSRQCGLPSGPETRALVLNALG